MGISFETGVKKIRNDGGEKSQKLSRRRLAMIQGV
jgi:hypothetical protein